jgi:hypothetical protein
MLKERNIKASQPSTGGKGWRGRFESRKFVSKRRQKRRAKRYFFCLACAYCEGGRRDGWGKGKVGQDQELRTKRGE